jgi:hypothetical protein
MNRNGLRIAIGLGALLAWLAGCGDATQPIISDPSVEPGAIGEVPAPPAADTFPEASGFAAVYDRDGPDRFGFRSRYVFHRDGTFSLQYANTRSGFVEYPGRYAVSDSRIELDFDGWSVAGPWTATGTLAGRELRVEYNIIMWLSDFDNGLYLLSEGDPPE